jgi:hypothetical protein
VINRTQRPVPKRPEELWKRHQEGLVISDGQSHDGLEWEREEARKGLMLPNGLRGPERLSRNSQVKRF